jgi:hypothetical protein
MRTKEDNTGGRRRGIEREYLQKSMEGQPFRKDVSQISCPVDVKPEGIPGGYHVGRIRH